MDRVLALQTMVNHKAGDDDGEFASTVTLATCSTWSVYC